jgi:DNA polymerase III delta subunit
MEGWIERRAKEVGVSLAPGAAKAVAERVGAFVREGDIDRRRQSELANAELEKLALYRPGGTVSASDVDALVSESVPGSTWAFLDAMAARRGGEAAMLLERLLGAGTAVQLLTTQIHRRLRDLIVVRDYMNAGTKPADLVRILKLQPYRAQKLAEQAARWDSAALDGALSGLLEIDLLSKGIGADGSPRSLSDDRSRLALMAWIGESARRA